MAYGTLQNDKSQRQAIEALLNGTAPLPPDALFPGSVARPLVEEVGDQPRSILAFAGSDAQARLASALASGELNLFVPAGLTVPIEAALTVLTGTRLWGQPSATLSASGVNDINILETAGNDVVIEDLAFVAPGLVTTSFLFSNTKPRGAAVALNGASRVALRRLDIQGHTAWGAYARNSTDVEIEGCHLHDGALPGSPNQGNCGGDIAVLGSATRVTVERNRCFGGLLTGVHCQTSTSSTPATQDCVTVRGNKVAGQGGYGIMVYNQDYTQDVMKRFLIMDNEVRNITGAIPFNNGGGDVFQYGMGIYAIKPNDIVVVLNRVYDTLASNVDETLGAGGITVADAKLALVALNYVASSTKYGFALRDANRSSIATQGLIALGNMAIDCGNHGFNLVELQNWVQLGNLAYNCGGSGFKYLGDGTDATRQGIALGNLANGNTANGFYAATSSITDLIMAANLAAGNGSRGIGIDNATIMSLIANLATGNTSGQILVNTSATVRAFLGNLTSGASDVQHTGNVVDGAVVRSETTGTVNLSASTARTQIFRAPLTGHVTLNLPDTSGRGLTPGYRIRVVRESTCTGAFNVTATAQASNAITGAVVLSAASQWLEFEVTDNGAWATVGGSVTI